MSDDNSRSIRYAVAWTGALFSFIYGALWVLDIINAWKSCYASAVAFSVLYLWTHRRNLISLSGFFIGLSLIAITLPAVPYLIFELESHPSFYASIYLNSLGQIYFVTLALILVPARSLYCANSGLFVGQRWDRFVRINGVICLVSVPFVLLAITEAGAWGYLLGSRTGDYDRIASMKGLGPLMVFSVVNMMALFFWATGVWLQGMKWRALVVSLLLLFLNGFTGGRQNYIAFFLGCLIIYVALIGFNKRLLLLVPTAGFLIVFMKALRVGDLDNVVDVPWYVSFFLHFAGDFDSLNNDSVLIEYTREHGFFGFYHIWSNVLIYLPRDFFPWKPHDLGGLYLNTYLFPGVYLGAEGGTGLAIGFQGIWYAAYGLSTLLLGNFLLAFILSWNDRYVYRSLHHLPPGLFLVVYIFLIGQSVIIYRDGFYAFLNAGLYVGIYYILFKSIQPMVKKNAAISPSRPLVPT